MGVYVIDGYLIGTVIEDNESIKELYKNEDKHQDIIEKIENVIKLQADNIKLLADEARGLFGPCNSYNSSTPIYLGIFLVWSRRKAMELDEKWKPLYIQHPKSAEIIKKKSYSEITMRLFGSLVNYFPRLEKSDVKIFQARRWA